jgi:nucleotide-binding universal stress UspA family protein
MGVIVVGVDGSENSVEALRWAAKQAEATGAELRVVFVWEYPYMGIAAPTVVSPVPNLGAELPPFHEMQSAAAAELDEIVERAHLPSGISVERRTVRGTPVAGVLLEEAKDAELIVTGARGRGGFIGLLTGSVATQLVNHATVPVVVIRA